MGRVKQCRKELLSKIRGGGGQKHSEFGVQCAPRVPLKGVGKEGGPRAQKLKSVFLQLELFLRRGPLEVQVPPAWCEQSTLVFKITRVYYEFETTQQKKN